MYSNLILILVLLTRTEYISYNIDLQRLRIESRDYTTPMKLILVTVQNEEAALLPSIILQV